MKNVSNWLIITAMFILAPAAFAQQGQGESPKTEKESRREVQKQIAKSAKDLRNTIKEARKRYENGEITQEEMEEIIEEAAEKLALDLERLGLEMEMTIENKIDQDNVKTKKPKPEEDEDSNIVSIEEDPSTGEKKVKVKVKSKPKNPPRTDFGLNIAFGRNTQIVQGTQLEDVVYPEMEFWRGRYSEWGIMAHTRIGSRRSPLYLNYGLSLVYNKTDIGGNNRLIISENGPIWINNPSEAFTRNRFENHYINAQLGIRICPKGPDGFHLEFNGFAGTRFRTKQVLEYNSTQNERVREIRRNPYGTNPFNYGISAAIGYDCISLFARYELSSLFQNNSIYDFRPFSAGIRFNII